LISQTATTKSYKKIFWSRKRQKTCFTFCCKCDIITIRRKEMLTIKKEDIYGQDDEEPSGKYNKQMDV
tara:strand:- start:558 stop:761 length:204 start_codon:yes stop_codon:yes gene_type:complete